MRLREKELTMTVITPIRITTVLGTIALLAAALVSSAGADTLDGRSPDTKDAAAHSSGTRPSDRGSDCLIPGTSDSRGQAFARHEGRSCSIGRARSGDRGSDRLSPDITDSCGQALA